MADVQKPALLLSVGDEPAGKEEKSGPLLSDEESGGTDDVSDSQLNAASLVASALKKGDPSTIAKALKLFMSTCSYE
jgi:hypothetical protein